MWGPDVLAGRLYNRMMQQGGGREPSENEV